MNIKSKEEAIEVLDQVATVFIKDQDKIEDLKKLIDAYVPDSFDPETVGMSEYDIICNRIKKLFSSLKEFGFEGEIGPKTQATIAEMSIPEWGCFSYGVTDEWDRMHHLDEDFDITEQIEDIADKYPEFHNELEEILDQMIEYADLERDYEDHIDPDGTYVVIYPDGNYEFVNSRSEEGELYCKCK